MTDKEAKMNRCAIYARCSTRDQDTENQIAALREYAKRSDWAVVEELVDVASGSKSAAERAGLDRVMELARKKKVDVVLFWALDRFSREGARKTIEYLGVFDDAGVSWHSYSEPYISSMGVFREAIIAIMGALAKQERVRISERTKAGLARVMNPNGQGTESGKPVGRPARDAQDVARVVAMRADGRSFGTIAKELGISRGWACKLAKGGNTTETEGA